MGDDERLEALKAWQETWKDKGYPYPVPTASFLAGFDAAAAARVRAAQAKAWDEGADYVKEWSTSASYVDTDTANPHRSDAGDEFQNPED